MDILLGLEIRCYTPTHTYPHTYIHIHTHPSTHTQVHTLAYSYNELTLTQYTKVDHTRPDPLHAADTNN